MKIKLLFILLITCTGAFGQIRYGNYGRTKSENTVRINYSNPKEYTIAEIQVVGAEYLDHIALTSISGLKVGDKVKIPGDDITQAIKKLWKQGLIGNVEIYATKVEGSNIYLTIELTERPRLSRFNFHGITKSEESDLREKINLIRGRVMTDAIIKNSELTVKKYFYEKGFLNTQVDIRYSQDSIISNSVMLDIDIEKNRKVKIRNVNFVGNENFPEMKLKGKMKNTGERPRFKIAGALIATGINALKPKDKRVKIKDEEDTAWYSLTKPLINLVIENVKLNVFKSSKFVEEKYKEDKEALIAFYNSKGYRDAYIAEDTIVTIDENSVDIDIRIVPGQQYFFREITWTGNFIHDDRTLDQILGVERGDIYNMESLDKKLNYNPNGPDISSLYMDNGYLFFSVNPVEVKIEGDSIDVEMRIYEGAQATIRKVYVTGNDRTNDHVIMRELRTLPGQKFSRSELIRTQRELSQLGYFNPETVSPNPIPNPVDETVDIEWSLEERPSDQIELSGGWGGSFGFVGTLGLTFNNFSLRNLTHFDKWRPLPVGDGQKLSLRLQANGRQFQSYSISFSEPWLGGKKPKSFGVSYNYSVQRSLNPYNRREILGSMQVTGVTVSLGQRLKWPDDYFTLSNAVSYTNYNLYRFGQSLGFDEGTGIANNFTFTTTLSRNSVDSPMYPRNGSSISLSLALTPPYSLFNDIDYQSASNNDRYKWVEYHKWMFDAKYYMQLAGNLVLSARAHMGYLGSYQSTTGIGPFERFQLGGDGLTGSNFLLGNDIIGLRGYDNNSITPTETVNGNVIRGGTLYNKFVFELRYPVSLNPSATIYVLSFAEAGNNWLDFTEYNPNNLYTSAGAGVRIFMPAFGLLGIDWGYGFDPDPSNPNGSASGGQIHFSIGQTLR
ncbi:MULTISPECIES: BamA/OMP85 family outer membrane protein [Reichenbachiella]|uniref:BamA/OMP85 family outer membrane protein n=1 Tax=Reichenbachiella TaxID=156993 RepID=UPI000E6B4F89|nr:MULTISPECIES: POTRA domain-containing protein [Reichenbachiella]MBU2915595.1 BamA/TamA family outer membrane protein [Reichenbachiella agariperforans]RJE71344.1 outer membrane protein assembly factor BamA [Reichenbachiella sp. MSK19-1]